MNKMLSLGLIIAALLGVWWIYGNYGGELKTGVVVAGSMEDAFNIDAVVVRNERVITADAGGMVQSLFADGQRVEKNAKVAVLFKGNIDQNLQKQLQAVNERIASISQNNMQKDLFLTDSITLESRISEKTLQMAACARDGNQASINRLRDEVNVLLEKKTTISGEKGPAANVLEDLKRDKDAIEKSINASKTDIYTDTSGVYCQKTDGLEDVLNFNKLSNINKSELEAVLAKNQKNKDTKEQQSKTPFSVCKIIDNIEWGMAILADAKQVSGLKEGTPISLRLTGAGATLVNAYINSVSQEQNKKVVLTISCTKTIEGIFTNRIMNVDIVKSSYKGLKVPVSSLTTKDGKSGVYILKAGGPTFRECNVLFKDKEFALLQENNNAKDCLLLFDEIITSSKALLKD